MKIIFTLMAIISFSQLVSAKPLGTKEKKTEFATSAITELLADKGEGYKFVPDSIEIGKCEGMLNRLGATLSLLTSECNTIYFNVWDKNGKIHGGKLNLMTAKANSKIAKDGKAMGLGLKNLEFYDEATQQPLVMVLDSLSSKNAAKMSTAEMLDLEKLKGAAATKAETAAGVR